MNDKPRNHAVSESNLILDLTYFNGFRPHNSHYKADNSADSQKDKSKEIDRRRRNKGRRRPQRNRRPDSRRFSR